MKVTEKELGGAHVDRSKREDLYLHRKLMFTALLHVTALVKRSILVVRAGKFLCTLHNSTNKCTIHRISFGRT